MADNICRICGFQDCDDDCEEQDRNYRAYRRERDADIDIEELNFDDSYREPRPVLRHTPGNHG